MKVTPLRHIIVIQTTLVIIFAFTVITLLGTFWLVPQIRKEIMNRQHEYATAVGAQIQGYLTATMVIAKASARMLETDLSADKLQYMLDSHIGSSESIDAIYLITRDGYIKAVGLAEYDAGRNRELQHIDLSASCPVKKNRADHSPQWSDTFMSSVSGGLSVAYVVPAKDMAVIAELQLKRLVRVLKGLSEKDKLLILITDRRGQIIADQDGRYTAQQLNVSNIPLVEQAIKSGQPSAGVFQFEGKQMIGSMIQIPSIDWYVLTAHPSAAAMHTLRVAAGIAFLGFVLITVAGILLSIVMSRRLAKGFEALAIQTRKLASEGCSGEWPVSGVAELRELSENISRMAFALCEREAELSRAKEYSDNLIKVANIVIVSLDVAGRITMLNQTAEKLIGYDFPEISGQEWFSLVTLQEQLPEQFAEFKTIIQNGCAGSYESRIITRDGQIRTIRWYNNPIFNCGEVVGVILFGVDISEQRLLEERLRQGQKMESIGRLAGGIAHDFNNKLTVILGYSEMLKKRFPVDSRECQYLLEIVTAAEHSCKITGQLLAFSRQQIIKPAPLDVNAALAGYMKTLSRLIGEDILFETVLCSDLWWVNMDPTQFDQIIMNLAVNARDAMPDGGKITIRTSNAAVTESMAYQLIDATPGDFVLITFSDTGVGMDHSITRHIFEPFFTTKQVGKGTGLGLATIYGIVTQNNGFIDVESAMGQGTTFKVYLPRMSEELTVAPQANCEAVTGAGTVLLVEDDAMVRQMVTLMLEELGYQVKFASCAEEAIEFCRDRQESIDLILTDVIMPLMNGKEMADNISRIRPGIPILYMSGHTFETISKKGIMEEDMYFIQKPFDLRGLSSKIAEVLN